MKLPLFHALVWSLGAVCAAQGQSLSLEKTKIDAKAQLGQRYVVLDFPFRNTGTAPLQITGADTSCTCASYTFSSTYLAPGEGGRITVTLDMRGKTGKKYSELVFIKTNEPGIKPYAISGVVDLPPTLSLEPRLLRWTVGEQPVPRRARLTATPALRAETVKGAVAKLSSNLFTVSLTSDDAGGLWIEVQPRSTAARAQALIKPDFGTSDTAEQIPELYAYVSDTKE